MEQNQTQNHTAAEDEQQLSKTSVRNPVERAMLIIAGSIIVFALIIGGTILYVAKNIIAPRINRTQQSNLLSSQPRTNQATPDPISPTKVSVDNDPVMGSKDAPVTVIEFADFECPFCKQSFKDVIPKLKQQYIDTGKVKLVYRDFPLDFHENAHKEAEAGECVRDQGGDTAFFQYHDQVFTKTTSNGTGLALTQLPVIAKSLGLNVKQFQQCLDSGKYKDEVDKDIADGIAAGVSGTPTWFIGKPDSDGAMTATPLVGAQPFAAFKTIIDQQLK